MRLTTQSPDGTQAFGQRLGALLAVGDLVLLRGTMGAGKTTLTQGIAWGAGVTGYAHSPTFVLVNEYRGRLPLYHLDLYRFAGDDAVQSLGEVEDLAIDEMLEEGACVVEWAERAAPVFAGDHLEIALAEGAADDERLLVLTAHGERPVRLLSDLANSGGTS